MSLIKLYERKQYNYLLRSTRSYDLIRFAVLIREGRVQIDFDPHWSGIYSKYGVLVEHCEGFADAMFNHGLAEIVRSYDGRARDEYVLTGEGYRCLDGAFRVNGLEAMSVIEEIDRKAEKR